MFMLIFIFTFELLGESCELHTSCAIDIESDSTDVRCSNHGSCKENVCFCRSGWSGVECEIEDCFPADCNGNGMCIEGACFCNNGWQGIYIH